MNAQQRLEGAIVRVEESMLFLLQAARELQPGASVFAQGQLLEYSRKYAAAIRALAQRAKQTD